MFHWRTRLKHFSFGLILLPLLCSCGFADLRILNFATVPAEPYAVLPESDSHVIIYFDTEMKKIETETVLSVNSPQGPVEGDLKWEGNELHFIPAAPWISGLRYVMKISGIIFSMDGRDLQVSRELPFYAPSFAMLPNLLSVSPQDGASVLSFIPGEIMLSLEFSQPMDRKSTESSLNCDGGGEKIFQWSDDDRLLNVLPGNSLSPWTAYRWSLSEKALSREGAPLAKAASGRFITDLDRVFPRVLKVVPLLRGGGNSDIWGSWVQLDRDLENGLGPGQGIGVEFSKPMDMERLRFSFGFEPSLAGHLEMISPASAVYVPDRNPEPESLYTMKISGDVRDSRGLKMGEEYRLLFHSDLPYLSILSLVFDEGEPITDPEKAGVFFVKTEEADRGLIRFAIHFSLPFSAEAQGDFISGISLKPFFPNTLGSVNLRFVRWPGSDLVRMEWEGIEAGKDGEAHYYKLVLPGGKSGISNGEASYMKEEMYFYFEAVKK